MSDSTTTLSTTSQASYTSFGARKLLVLIAVLFLPFTYALTVNVAFPVKVYEVSLLLLGLSYFLDPRVFSAPSAAWSIRPLVGLLAIASVVLLVRTVWPPITLELGAYRTRFGPVGDGIAKLLYLCLSIFGFLVFSYCAYRHERQFLALWVAGALVASAYTWYLFTASALGQAPLLLPGIDQAQHFNIGGTRVIRSGTFKEGNFLGLYLLLSIAVALYARYKVPSLLLSLTVFITFSTASVIGLVVLWGGVAWHRVAKQRGLGRRSLYITVLCVIVAATVLLLAATGYAERVVLGKLLTSDPGSKLDRLDLAVAGLRMFLAHPIAGVGISQYGYHYHAYQLTDIFEQFRVNKPIPNNVYIEVLSELGLVGFLFFAAFLVNLYRVLRDDTLMPLRWGFIAMLLIFNAFPSYTIMFLWAYFGLIVAAAAKQRLRVPTLSPPTP